VLLKNRDCLGCPGNVLGFIGHIPFLDCELGLASPSDFKPKLALLDMEAPPALAYRE